MREFSLGTVWGLQIQAGFPAVLGFLLIWVCAALVGLLWLELDGGRALVLGASAALLHTLMGLIHHYGHAIAARSTGYPMRGVRLGRMLVLGESIYPKDEPSLPARVHIQRALGGPIASLLSALLAGLLAWSLRSESNSAGWLALFTFLDSFLIYFLGVLLPLGFTDMSTILQWRGK